MPREPRGHGVAAIAPSRQFPHRIGIEADRRFERRTSRCDLALLQRHFGHLKMGGQVARIFGRSPREAASGFLMPTELAHGNALKNVDFRWCAVDSYVIL